MIDSLKKFNYLKVIKWINVLINLINDWFGGYDSNRFGLNGKRCGTAVIAMLRFGAIWADANANQRASDREETTAEKCRFIRSGRRRTKERRWRVGHKSQKQKRQTNELDVFNYGWSTRWLMPTARIVPKWIPTEMETNKRRAKQHCDQWRLAPMEITHKSNDKNNGNSGAPLLCWSSSLPMLTTNYPIDFSRTLTRFSSTMLQTQ